LPVLLLEPVSNIKRRHLFEMLTGPVPVSSLTLDEVKARLKEIRRYALDHQDELIVELTANLAAHPDIEVTLAQNAGQAVKTIQKVARSNRIAINKSAVVSNELTPALIAAGYTILESYYDEFEVFDNQSSQYWQLADMPFESRFQSFERPLNLAALRSESLHKNGAKDFTGLIGINAIAAEDGTILLFQHMHNISKVYSQARDLILVVGLDKLVKNLEEAVFQTKCMATFGSEVLPLTLPDQPREKGQLDRLPFDVSWEQTSAKIHLILLDNGRRQVLKGAYKDLLTCIDCQACTKGCPTSQFFSDSLRWSPRTYLYSFLTESNHSLGLCLQCKSCKINCPLEIDLSDMILEAKNRIVSGQHRSLINILIANAGILESVGSSAAWLTNITSSNRPLRWLGEKMFNISRERQLPNFKQRTFAKWFKARADAGKS
jgi:L-lactate utilization protein LutB